MTHSKDALFVAMVDFNLPTIEVGLQKSDRGPRVLLKRLAPWAIPLGLLTIFAMPAMANHIDTATVTEACDSYTICVSASALDTVNSYTITYEITVTPSSGTRMTISNSIPVTPIASDGTFSTCVTQSLDPLTGSNSFMGSASLVANGTTVVNTIPITFSPNPLSCPTPCPTVTPTPTPTSSCPPCATSCIQANFNGTAIPAGDSIWFNAHISASGIPSSGATITFCGSTVTSSAFLSAVPNGVIVFSPSASCATTTFDSSSNTWTTTVPVSGSDEIFLTGLVLPVPSGLPGGGISPNWCGIFSSNVPGVSLSWQWGAAVYTCLPAPPGVYNILNVKPTHSNACNVNNGDHAGTPENSTFKACVTGGARGGGGSNFTGSWSGTVSTHPCVP